MRTAWIIFLILLVLKVTGVIAASWVAVFSPLLAVAGLLIILFALYAAAQ